MSDDSLIDKDGVVHEKGWDGQYHPKQGFFGPERDTDWTGQPKVERDWLGRPKEETDWLGRSVQSRDGETLYRRSGSSGGSSNSDWSSDVAGALLGVVLIIVFTLLTFALILLWKVITSIHKELIARYGEVAILYELVGYGGLLLVLVVLFSLSSIVSSSPDNYGYAAPAPYSSQTSPNNTQTISGQVSANQLPATVVPTLSPSSSTYPPPTMPPPTRTAVSVQSIPPSCKASVAANFIGIWNTPPFFARLGCPISGELKSASAVENFQGGFMVWRELGDRVYAIYNNGTWGRYPKGPSDRFIEGTDPEYSCGPQASPPSPRRGFSKIWCNHQEVRATLGNATEYEQGYCMPGGGPCELFQDFENGTMYRSSRFGNVFILFSDGTWQKR